jgi:hypothetical protein
METDVAWSSFFLQEQKNTGNFKAMVGYSDGLNDLVSQMLHLDPAKRPTAGELLGSPFGVETVMKIHKQIT